MKLFESTWRDKYEYFERVFDTNLEKSVVRKIHTPAEWYEESSKGDYKYILDDKVKLVKKQGKAKDGRYQYGFTDPMYRNIKDNYWNKDQYNQKPRTWYLDIETRSGVVSSGFPVPEKALEEITLIQVFDSNTQTMFIIGSRPWYHQNDYKFDYPVKYIEVKNERELLETYIKIFKKLDPLIIYAWNGSGFDFPYLYTRMLNLGMDVNDLSNYGNVNLKTSLFKGKLEFKFTSDGHFYIDLLVVYRKFTFGDQASYSLDYTAELVLGKKKVDHSEYAAFDDFYAGKYIIPTNPTNEQRASKIYKAAIANDWDLVKELAYSDFVYYGGIDTHLITEIDKARNFTDILLMISEKMGVQLSDATGTVKPWSQYITNKALLNKQCMPIKTEINDEIQIKGGFVREPQVKKHSWVLSADVNSMYPLLGMTGFNMSPETFVDRRGADFPEDLRTLILSFFNDEDEESKLKINKDTWEHTKSLLQKYDYALSINGAVFKKDKLGMIPEMVTDIYATRKVAKKTMFKYEKRKILIQSILDSRNE